MSISTKAGRRSNQAGLRSGAVPAVDMMHATSSRHQSRVRRPARFTLDPTGADIARPDLKSPSYQGLTLVSPGVSVRENRNPKFHDIRRVGAGQMPRTSLGITGRETPRL